MAQAKSKSSSESEIRIRTALTPEAEEMQMISLAMDCARQQLLDGTASSQVITHFLKLGSERERLERERLQEENKLLRAKTEALESAKHVEELYAEAIKAMKRYSGNSDSEESYEEYDQY